MLESLKRGQPSLLAMGDDSEEAIRSTKRQRKNHAKESREAKTTKSKSHGSSFFLRTFGEISVRCSRVPELQSTQSEITSSSGRGLLDETSSGHRKPSCWEADGSTKHDRAAAPRHIGRQTLLQRAEAETWTSRDSPVSGNCCRSLSHLSCADQARGTIRCPGRPRGNMWKVWVGLPH